MDKELQSKVLEIFGQPLTLFPQIEKVQYPSDNFFILPSGMIYNTNQYHITIINKIIFALRLNDKFSQIDLEGLGIIRGAMPTFLEVNLSMMIAPTIRQWNTIKGMVIKDIPLYWDIETWAYGPVEQSSTNKANQGLPEDSPHYPRVSTIQTGEGFPSLFDYWETTTLK